MAAAIPVEAFFVDVVLGMLPARGQKERTSSEVRHSEQRTVAPAFVAGSRRRKHGEVLLFTACSGQSRKTRAAGIVDIKGRLHGLRAVRLCKSRRAEISVKMQCRRQTDMLSGRQDLNSQMASQTVHPRGRCMHRVLPSPQSGVQ